MGLSRVLRSAGGSSFIDIEVGIVGVENVQAVDFRVRVIPLGTKPDSNREMCKESSKESLRPVTKTYSRELSDGSRLSYEE